MSAISIRSLDKRYGATHVLRSIDLEVAEGDFTVLLGPSGCGKSTLLNVIAGLEEVDEGQVLIGAEDVTSRAPDKRGIGMVFQSYALYPTMNVKDNLSFGLRVQRMPKDEIARRVEWAAGVLQLDRLLSRRPGQLSGGQRQRVAIGRALVRRAKVFLFDEPLSNLDAKLRAEMRLELKRLHKQLGNTMIFVTHDQIEAMTLATRIAVMNQGRVEQYAEPQTLYDLPETLFVAGFVGSPAMNFVPGTLVRRDGAVFIELPGHTVSLDAYPFKSAPRGGEEVVFGIRPEHVHTTDSTGALTLPHLVSEAMGADTLVWLDWQAQRLSLRLDPQSARGIGQNVSVVFDVARSSVFAKDSGLRL